MPIYEITVVTGNCDGAGTDANIYVQLYGSQNNSSEIFIDDPDKNNFERNACDTFEISLPELGDIHMVNIKHDNTHESFTPGGPGWFLHCVWVYNKDTKTLWAFVCDRWLARDEDDHQISRSLTQLQGYPPPPPCIKKFFVNPDYINPKTISTLTWTIYNCYPETNPRISIIGLSGYDRHKTFEMSNLPPMGKIDVTPSQSTEYILSATNDGCVGTIFWPGGPVTESKTVIVYQGVSNIDANLQPFYFQALSTEFQNWCSKFMIYASNLSDAKKSPQYTSWDKTKWKITDITEPEYFAYGCKIPTKPEAGSMPMPLSINSISPSLIFFEPPVLQAKRRLAEATERSNKLIEIMKTKVNVDETTKEKI